jgi:hypothetical protein
MCRIFSEFQEPTDEAPNKIFIFDFEVTLNVRPSFDGVECEKWLPSKSFFSYLHRQILFFTSRLRYKRYA